jgi:hypothetical protein
VRLSDQTERVVYEESVRTVDGQRELLEGVRARAGTLLATAFVATAFFGAQRLDDDLYRITAEAAVAPGREWLAEELLLKLARERTDGLLVHGPVVTPIDEQATSRFARAAWLGRGQRDATQPLARIRAVERRLRRRG